MEMLEKLCHTWFDRVWNQKDAKAIDEMLAPKFVAHGLGPKMEKPDDFKPFYNQFLQAFPDIKIKVDRVVAQGDWSVTRVIARGSHKGPFNGLEATGNPFEIDAMVMMRWENGQIVEAYNLVDMLGLMQQIGALPKG